MAHWQDKLFTRFGPVLDDASRYFHIPSDELSRSARKSPFENGGVE
jgi:hypothetical protein